MVIFHSYVTVYQRLCIFTQDQACRAALRQGLRGVLGVLRQSGVLAPAETARLYTEICGTQK